MNHDPEINDGVDELVSLIQLSTTEMYNMRVGRSHAS